MSEEMKAKCRAQGAFDNFIEAMENEMELRGRSPQYIVSFWEALRDKAADFIFQEKGI